MDCHAVQYPAKAFRCAFCTIRSSSGSGSGSGCPTSTRRAIRPLLCVVAAGFIFAATALPQQQDHTPPSSIPYENDPGNLPAQPIGPNDLLAVSVYDSPELTRTIRVNRDGEIRLPMLHNPIVFQATHPITLLDAIARAGGISEDAGSEILVRHEISQGDDPQWVTETVPVRQLIDQADQKLNITLHGGEQVLVPEAKKIYVVGNVRKPGAFPVRNDENTTVLQALALSEGLMPFTAKQAYIYRHVYRSQGGSSHCTGQDHEAQNAGCSIGSQ